MFDYSHGQMRTKNAQTLHRMGLFQLHGDTVSRNNISCLPLAYSLVVEYKKLLFSKWKRVKNAIWNASILIFY